MFGNLNVFLGKYPTCNPANQWIFCNNVITRTPFLVDFERVLV
jgi:hypothetical protein